MLGRELREHEQPQREKGGGDGVEIGGAPVVEAWTRVERRCSDREGVSGGVVVCEEGEQGRVPGQAWASTGRRLGPKRAGRGWAQHGGKTGAAPKAGRRRE